MTPAPGRLQWRCRRGMRELDVLLSRWLEHHWQAADPRKRQAFELLLESTDPDLADWLLGRARPADPRFGALVDEIREA